MINKVVIVGAGPAGVLLAHYLLRRGNYQVNIYERRSDPRLVNFANERTFPLSLQERGKMALRRIEGLAETIYAKATFCTGTLLYQKKGKRRLVARKKPLLTIDRNLLVVSLLERLAQKYDNSQLNIHFNCQCNGVNANEKTVTFETERDKEITVDYDLLIGADGAGSVVRSNFLTDASFQCEQEYIQDAYKTIFLPRLNPNLKIELEPDKLHTWRLDSGTRLMMVPQPKNRLNGVIIFNPQNNPLEHLSSKEEVLDFFRQNFPVLGQLMTAEEAEAFLNRPVSKVLTVQCNRYHQADSIVILGDAAHAVSPSIGQGCNSALEDALILDNLLDEYQENWGNVLLEFTKRRIPDGHALGELSNYSFPRTKRLTFEFFLRLNLARVLHKSFPQFFQPFLFDMVSDSIVPYSEILRLHQGWINKVKNSLTNV